MTVKLANNATSTLAADIADNATSLTIHAADATLFPTLGLGDWFPVTVIALTGDLEIMKCTARSSATLTVERAQEGTAALAFLAGARVSVRLTAAAIAEMAGATVNSDDITEGVVQLLMTAVERGKVGHLSITQAVDLDDIETRVNALDAAVVLKGTWDASSGSFPGAGAAQRGWSYIVSVAGIVDGQDFNIGDRAIALVDNASTSTFDANWFKADYTDQVSSVAGLVGAIAASALKTALAIAVADITDASANGRSLINAANYAAMRVLLGLVIGTNVQAFDLATAKTNAAQTFTKPQRVSFTTLTYAATVTPDLNANNGFVLTMTGNPTIANPSNIASAVGQEIMIVFRGAYQPSFGSYWKFPGGEAPTFVGGLNVVGGIVISATEISAFPGVGMS